MVTVNEEFNHIPDIQKELRYIMNHHIEIGVFQDSGDYSDQDISVLAIARINEFGIDIVPKEAKALTIPLNKRAAKHSAGDFEDLVLLDKGDDGDGILAFVDGKNIEPMYALVKKVKIPERAFMRGAFDKRKNKMQKQAEKILNDVLMMKTPAKAAMNSLGQIIVTQVQEYMTNLRTPPNAEATQKAKGSSNPLINSGKLRDSIDYKIRRN
jgi:hypothetical protein